MLNVVDHLDAFSGRSASRVLEDGGASVGASQSFPTPVPGRHQVVEPSYRPHRRIQVRHRGIDAAAPVHPDPVVHSTYPPSTMLALSASV